MDANILRSKFRGCLLGSLLGECLGSIFEDEMMIKASKVVLKILFEKLEEGKFEPNVTMRTSNIILMKSICKTLLTTQSTDYNTIANVMADDYILSRRIMEEPVTEILYKIKLGKLDDVFQPAKEKYAEDGSQDNCAATRMAPVALYHHDNYDRMVNVATNIAKITHSHPIGINGALLQCIALHQCVNITDRKLEIFKFVEQLKAKMNLIDMDNNKPFLAKLSVVSQFLSRERPVELSDEHGQVVGELGNNYHAVESVPTAIYCFLRCQENIEEIDSKCFLRRVLEYAISLGGDADKIACLTGALCGAYLGAEHCWLFNKKFCKYYDEVLKLVDDLFKVVINKKNMT